MRFLLLGLLVGVVVAVYVATVPEEDVQIMRDFGPQANDTIH